MSRSGLFISFEGIDGSGKSTQARLLTDHLRGQGREVVLTREPGGSPGAEEIRKLVLEGAPDRWSPETELLLFTAARRDHLERVIRPALKAGKVVICDRFADSTRAYQGRAGPDMHERIDQLHHLMIRREPDLTILVDMDPATGLERAQARGMGEQRFETLGLELQQQIRADFLAMAKEFSNRFVIIDGGRAMHEVAADIQAQTARHLP